MARHRKIAEFASKDTGIRAKVYRDTANDEFVVCIYDLFGEHIEDSDYYTNDKDDTLGTAELMCGGKEVATRLK